MKYSIDYYQREYRWEAKQVRELLDDLTQVFLADYEPGIARNAVGGFTHYFLGSIIVSQKDSESFIVDGQQRLTSLTLLLILLRNLQRSREDAVSIDDLIYSERYGERTFNARRFEQMIVDKIRSTILTEGTSPSSSRPWTRRWTALPTSSASD